MSGQEEHKIWENLTLWELTYKLAEKERRIMALIKAGEEHNASGVLRKLKHQRNDLRRAMLKKLIIWNEGKLIEHQPTYSDLNRGQEANKQSSL